MINAETETAARLAALPEDVRNVARLRDAITRQVADESADQREAADYVKRATSKLWFVHAGYPRHLGAFRTRGLALLERIECLRFTDADYASYAALKRGGRCTRPVMLGWKARNLYVEADALAAEWITATFAPREAARAAGEAK